jgi:three-Cys-motif partner protein
LSKPIGTIWELEPHTAKKHDILRSYFQAWLPIMASWNGRVLYIDGFAGPGKYSKGEDGSPVIVLKAARDHNFKIKAELVCLFIELDSTRFQHLEAILEELRPTLPKNITFKSIKGAFNEQLAQVFAFLQEQKKTIAPTLVFVDPFGFSHTPFSTIAKVMENRRCEVLVNFMYEEINRFLSHPDHTDTFDALFGTNTWREALQAETAAERRRIIHDLYLKQLRTVAKYVRSFQILNSGNRTDYFLYFATNDLTGLRKMKEAMWRVDKSAGAQFSDYTDSSTQLRLLEKEPDYARLQNLLVDRFRGKRFTIDELEDWVTADTEFLPTHLRKKALSPMEKDGALIVVQSATGRRKGTFPSGTVLQVV